MLERVHHSRRGRLMFCHGLRRRGTLELVGSRLPAKTYGQNGGYCTVATYSVIAAAAASTTGSSAATATAANRTNRAHLTEATCRTRGGSAHRTRSLVVRRPAKPHHCPNQNYLINYTQNPQLLNQGRRAAAAATASTPVLRGLFRETQINQTGVVGGSDGGVITVLCRCVRELDLNVGGGGQRLVGDGDARAVVQLQLRQGLLQVAALSAAGGVLASAPGDNSDT